MSNALSRRNVGTPIILGGAAAEQGYRAHLRRHIANLPDPGDQAYHLTEREHHALKTAWLTPAGWRVRVEYQAELAREGLCEVPGPHLTAWGMAVRRVVLREDA